MAMAKKGIMIILITSMVLSLGDSFVIHEDDKEPELSSFDTNEGGNVERLAINLANSKSELNLLDLTNALIKGGIEETIIGALRNEESGESENDLKAIGSAIKQGFMKLQEKASHSDRNAVAKGKAEESLVHVDVQGPPGRQIGQNKFANK